MCQTILHVSPLCHRPTLCLYFCQVFCESIARVSSLCGQHHLHVHDVSRTLPSASNVTVHKLSVTKEGSIVCRQSNVCFRPRLTLIPCAHARQPCTFGLCFFRAHAEVHDRLQHCVLRDCTSTNRCAAQPTKILGCVSSSILLVPTIQQHCSVLLSPVCASCGVIFSTATQVHIALYKEVLDPSGMSHCPLCNWMAENDLNTTTSCVLNHELYTFSQCSYSLLCTSVCLTLFNCCHSCWQFQSSCCAVYNFTQTLFLITVHWDVSIMRLQHLPKTAQDLRILHDCDARLSQKFLHAVQHRPGSRLLHPC